jgi:hypothetical protein
MTGQALADPGAARQVLAMPTAGCRTFAASAAKASSSSARASPRSYCRITAPPAAPTSVSEPGKFPDDPCYMTRPAAAVRSELGRGWFSKPDRLARSPAPSLPALRETGLGAGTKGAAMTGSLILRTEFINSLVIDYQ